MHDYQKYAIFNARRLTHVIAIAIPSVRPSHSLVIHAKPVHDIEIGLPLYDTLVFEDS